jgi:hypothetical protein
MDEVLHFGQAVDYYQNSVVIVAVRQMRDEIHRNVLPGFLGDRKKF